MHRVVTSYLPWPAAPQLSPFGRTTSMRDHSNARRAFSLHTREGRGVTVRPPLTLHATLLVAARLTSTDSLVTAIVIAVAVVSSETFTITLGGVTGFAIPATSDTAGQLASAADARICTAEGTAVATAAGLA